MKDISVIKNLYKIKDFTLEEIEHRIIKKVMVDIGFGRIEIHTQCGLIYQFTQRLGHFSFYLKEIKSDMENMCGARIMKTSEKILDLDNLLQYFIETDFGNILISWENPGAQGLDSAYIFQSVYRIMGDRQ